MKEFWIYIVDHPQRDLPSLIWWAYNSEMHKNHKICLLPTSEISNDFFVKHKPHVIVWNYARRNNIEAIKQTKKLGIYNIVHDTEGIPYELSKYFKGITDDELGYIDEVWCWGSKQAEILNNRNSESHKKPNILVTGSIRYEYMKSLKKCGYKNKLGKLVWNTNYALLSPKYQSKWKEFSDYLFINNTSHQETLDFFLKIASKRQTCSEYIKFFLRGTKNCSLTIRPHPFESSSFYNQDILPEFPSTKISRDVDLNIDLEDHSLVLQNGCQTALDAFIRGMPSIRLEPTAHNIWSKVTPYIEPSILVNNYSSEEFLDDVLGKQKELFEEHNVKAILHNLQYRFNYSVHKRPNNSFKIQIRKLNLAQKLYGIKYQTIMNLKNIKAFLLNKKPNKAKLTSFMVKEYLEAHYEYQHWNFDLKCFLYPKN